MPSKRTLFTVGLSFFLLFCVNAVVGPFLQLFLRRRGFQAPQIGLLLGCYELVGVAGPLVMGRLADRSGHYRLLFFLCIAGSLASFLPMEWPAAMGPMLALMAAFGWTFKSCIPLQDSLAGRLLPDPTRQYGKVRIMGSISFVLLNLFFSWSGVLGGDATLPILAAFTVCAAATGAAVPLLPRVPRERAPRPAAGKGRLQDFDIPFWTVIFLVFLARFGMSAHYSFFSLFLQQLGIGDAVGFVWAIGSAAEIPFIWFSGALIRRFGIRALLLASLLAVALRLAVYGLFPTLPAVLAAQILHSLTLGVLLSVSVAYVNGKVRPEDRGLGMAVYNAVGIGLPAFLGSAGGGYLVERFGFRSLFLGYAAPPLAGAVLLLLAWRRLGGKVDGAGAARL